MRRPAFRPPSVAVDSVLPFTNAPAKLVFKRSLSPTAIPDRSARAPARKRLVVRKLLSQTAKQVYMLETGAFQKAEVDILKVIMCG